MSDQTRLPADPAQSLPAFGAPDTLSRAPGGRIVREKQPTNLEFPFSALAGPLMADDSLYVRSHFPEPAPDPQAWRLRVEGAVEQAAEWSLEELMALPAQSLKVTIECAGNGRVFLTPTASGVQWDLGGVGTAEWTGVPLSAVLERAGVREGALEVILEGADEGPVDKPPKPGAPIRYARSLPLAQAGEVLLAYAMNGQPLPAAHGFPLRAVVPGWYGMASVKWLERVVVSEQPFAGYFQTTEYAYWGNVDGIPTQLPITEMAVKSQIARPVAGERLRVGVPYQIQGAAWAGEPEITRVEVSTDGGLNWQDAELLGEPERFVWRLWSLAWTPERSGPHTLLARATDAQGRTQPEAHDANFGSYVIHHTLPIEVWAD